jgi:hypothetical protein
MGHDIPEPQKQTYPLKRLLSIVLLSWIAVIGVDFFLNAGLFSKLFIEQSPFLLPPEQSFRLIPVGYLAFLFSVVMLLWLMLRMQMTGWVDGLKFGLIIGLFLGALSFLGLLSISTASLALLIAWFIGQTVELAIAGLVIGSGLAAKRLSSLTIKVLAFFLAMFVITVILQSIGWATVVRIK